MWDTLSVYTDYTGSKHALESRLTKITDLEKQISEGESSLVTLVKHIEQITDDSMMPTKVREELQRDLAHVK